MGNRAALFWWLRVQVAGGLDKWPVCREEIPGLDSWVAPRKGVTFDGVLSSPWGYTNRRDRGLCYLILHMGTWSCSDRNSLVSSIYPTVHADLVTASEFCTVPER